MRRPLPGIGAVIAALLLAPAGVAIGARQEGRIAVLPFQAVASPPEAWPAVSRALQEEIARRGLAVVTPGEVDRELRLARIRTTSILSREEMSSLAGSLHADKLLVGTVFSFVRNEPASVSLAARIVDPITGTIEAAHLSFVDGKDFLGPLGGGGPASLDRTLSKAVRDLLEGLLGEEERTDGKRYMKSSTLAPDPAIYLAPSLSSEAPRRLAVLPLRNHAGELGAGSASAEVFTWCLVSSGRFELVDAGHATSRLLAEGWRTGSPVGTDQLLMVGRETGADAVLMGSVEKWIGRSTAAGHPAAFAFSARLLDARTGRILWAAEHDRKGDQTHIVYEIGQVDSVEALAAYAVYEALEPLLRRTEGAGIRSARGGPK